LVDTLVKVIDRWYGADLQKPRDLVGSLQPDQLEMKVRQGYLEGDENLHLILKVTNFFEEIGMIVRYCSSVIVKSAGRPLRGFGLVPARTSSKYSRATLD